MNFEDGKIDDYGTLKFSDDIGEVGCFTFRLSNKEVLKITKDGVFINNELIKDNGAVYEKFNKWLDKALKK